MTTKTARITILATPEFKDYLTREAATDQISVSELIRQRCTPGPSPSNGSRRLNDQEQELALLAAEVQKAIPKARKSLQEGLKAAAEVMAEINRSAAAARKSSQRRKVA